MTKAHTFSIYLLKHTFNAGNTLKDDTKLELVQDAACLPEGATLYVLDTQPYTPWWARFFGIQKPLNQASKGAIIFLRASGRSFAFCFGHVAHNLKDESYEYYFGLRATLNCVDPDKLRSTDVLEPSGAKRQRTQLPTAGDLTFFDVDSDSTILKSLTGKVKDAHKDVFKNVTGSSNIRISSATDAAGLIGLCEKILAMYQEETFKTAFPDIQNISPVRDPSVITQLNANLIGAFQAKDDALALSVPDIVDFGDGLWGSFAGAHAGKVY